MFQKLNLLRGKRNNKVDFWNIKNFESEKRISAQKSEIRNKLVFKFYMKRKKTKGLNKNLEFTVKTIH